MYQAYSEIPVRKSKKQEEPPPPKKPEPQEPHHHRTITGTLSAKYTGGINSQSEEANKELMYALRQNLIESVSIVCEQQKIVSIA